MQTLSYSKAHRPPKLRDELEAAIVALRPSSGETTWRYEDNGVEFRLLVPDGVDPSAVTAIVTGHDASTPSAAETEETGRRAGLRAFVDNVDAALAGWDGLNPAQKDLVLRRAVRAVRALARRELGE